MTTSKTYVVEITKFEQFEATLKIRARSPKAVVGKAVRMADFGDPRLKFTFATPSLFCRDEYSVRAHSLDWEPIYAELCPSERKLRPDPLTMFYQLVDFVDRYRKRLNQRDRIRGLVDPIRDPDGWLDFFFEDLRLKETVNSYRDLIPMKLRLFPGA